MLVITAWAHCMVEVVLRQEVRGQSHSGLHSLISYLKILFLAEFINFRLKVKGEVLGVHQCLP